LHSAQAERCFSMSQVDESVLRSRRHFYRFGFRLCAFSFRERNEGGIGNKAVTISDQVSTAGWTSNSQHGSTAPDARTIRHALDQLAANGSMSKESDEFLVETEMERKQREGTELHTAFRPEKSGEADNAPCGMDLRRHHRRVLRLSPEEDSQELTRRGDCTAEFGCLSASPF
jgi:hypothetical protein